MTIEQVIFDRFFSRYDALRDANKDVNGKGTMQRFSELLGSELDVFRDLATDMLDNTRRWDTMEARFIPYLEQHLGNDAQPFLLSSDETMRRRIIRHWHRLVAERTTIPCITKLFAWIGLSCSISELFDTGGFDSATTWDSDTRPTLDSGRCAPCVGYTVALTGSSVIDESLWFGILSVIAFNEPIDAHLVSIEYNTVQVYPLASVTITYSTQVVGLHSPEIAGGGTTVWLFGTGISDTRLGYQPTYTYPDTSTKTVDVYIETPTAVSTVRMVGQAIVGAFDLSLFTAAQAFDLSDNLALTSLSMPVSAANFGELKFRAVGLTALSFASLDNPGGAIDISQNPQMTAWTLQAVKTANQTLSLLANGTGLVGSVTLEPLTFGPSAVVSFVACPAITALTLATTANANSVQSLNTSYCAALTTLDISAMQGAFAELRFDGCALLSSLPLGGVVRPAASRVYGSYCISLTGVLNWTTLPISELVMQGCGIKGFVHATDSTAIALYDLRGSINLEYYPITMLSGLIAADNAEIHLEDCALVTSDVEDFISDVLAIIVARGEAVGGDYAGRTVYIGGTNGAVVSPGALSDVAALAGYSVQVLHN